ncbi:purine nucleosidase [Friedmanniella endophytica]|uniref:Purine nucleosidase n=1 Tax=Microlunatus kandeliicorticis TaxID=1759536 RepID=A0A7W3IV99_9ACTN|nr:nucleoside hydrolase [Microlunatus kandeliicorticis]MBA8795903.1 purine nucleosidase [Microlunatus kandeliicorticis]
MPDSSTSTPSDRVPVYLDCDTGIDDALALAYLLGRPDIDLVGIGSVSGNIDAERGARNTLDLLALAGRDAVPVAVGAHDPLTGSFAGGAPHVHGSNGIGDIDLPAAGRGPVDGSAADLLIRLAHEHAGRLQVIAVGPLTNLALALRTEPRLVDLVPRVTIMGGAALVPGNVTPVAEANIANDPEAAAAVVEASWPVTLVPLDVTLEHVLDEDDRSALLASGHPLPRALGEMLDLYYGFYVELYGERCSALHDPLAAALALDGVAATVAPAVPVTVDATDGPGRGQTICDLRNQRQRWVDRDGAHVRVVLEAEPPLGPHLMQTILGAFGS